jgi:hypothetical protein
MPSTGKRTLCLALSTLLLVACGGSKHSTSSDASTSASAPAATTTATTATSTTAKGPSVKEPAAPLSTAASVAKYAAICKTIIRASPGLSAGTKAKVQAICGKAAHGELAAARAAAKEVCVEVVDATPLPAAAKSRALTECKAT